MRQIGNDIHPPVSTNLLLIGYRGCGKTSVGNALSRLIHRPFLDLDRAIESHAGRSIRQIVQEQGWAGFRQVETEVLTQVLKTGGQVIATGGGVVESTMNRQLLHGPGITIWLSADIGTLVQRLSRDQQTRADRPSLTQRPLTEETCEVLARRTPLYRSVADMVVDTNTNDPDTIAAVIARQLETGEKGGG